MPRLGTEETEEDPQNRETHRLLESDGIVGFGERLQQTGHTWGEYVNEALFLGPNGEVIPKEKLWQDLSGKLYALLMVLTLSFICGMGLYAIHHCTASHRHEAEAALVMEVLKGIPPGEAVRSAHMKAPGLTEAIPGSTLATSPDAAATAAGAGLAPGMPTKVIPGNPTETALPAGGGVATASTASAPAVVALPVEALPMQSEDTNTKVTTVKAETTP